LKSKEEGEENADAIPAIEDVESEILKIISNS
jgi:hypothetical protein